MQKLKVNENKFGLSLRSLYCVKVIDDVEANYKAALHSNKIVMS
jgi:hypothetical protein